VEEVLKTKELPTFSSLVSWSF